MNLKVPGAILPLGCAILSTRAKTVRGAGTTPLRRTRVNHKTNQTKTHKKEKKQSDNETQDKTWDRTGRAQKFKTSHMI